MDGWIKLSRDLLESKVFVNPNDLKIWLWLMLKASTKDRFFSLKTGKGCQTVEVKRGQLIFGRNKAEQELKIDGSTIYRTLQKFESEQLITVKANNQYSLITVNDFINSQSVIEDEIFEISESEQPIIPEVNNQRTTNEQPMNNQRAGNEQPTNTVEESLDSKEGSESSESQKGKESDLPPANLFGETEPVKNGKAKKGISPAAKIPKSTAHLFRESQYFGKPELIQEQLNGTPYETAAVDYYHESAALWSESKGGKMVNWLAALKNWMARDMKENKFISKQFVENNKINGNGQFKTNGTNGGAAITGTVDIKARIAANNDKYGR